MTKSSGYYTYLIASLPALQFGMKPPFSFETFLDMCKDLVSEYDLAILKSAVHIGKGDYERDVPALRKWHEFDTALRNELIKVRAARKRLDAARFLRSDSNHEAQFTQIALNTYRNPSILDSERMLDQERWRALDRCALGHHFDLDILIVYAHKLLILERWERIDAADGAALLEEVLQAG